MSNTKHTPGPWTLTFSPYANAPAMVRSGAVDIADVFIDESPDQPKLIANARLIAAAPEMLEALRHVFDSMGPSHAPRHTVMLKQVRAAIAKAEGKQ